MPEAASCTSCGSTNVQKASHVHEMGSVTQETIGVVGGFAFARDGFAPVVAQHHTTSRSISTLAARLAPPKVTYEQDALRMLLGSAGTAIVGLAVVLLVRWAVANDTSFYARVDAQRAMSPGR